MRRVDETAGPRRARGSRTGSASEAAEALASPPAPCHRVAVLDSDSGFLLVLERRLRSAGWHAEVLARKPSAKRLAALGAEALIVDTALLGETGQRWLAGLCRERPELSVIVCTASSTVLERVSALRAGVDDWLAKPCHPEELVVRLEGAAAHRRRAAPGELAPVVVGEVEIRPDHHQAFVGEESLELTRREFQLLRLLAAAGGEVLPRERIYESLWGYEMVRNDRSVDVFVHKLRRKIERLSPGWSYIRTEFGIGYKLVAAQTPAPAPAAGPRIEPLAA
jgi:DNA-binding response OmpR family regulator